jgi:hypothetical protein
MFDPFIDGRAGEVSGEVMAVVNATLFAVECP